MKLVRPVALLSLAVAIGLGSNAPAQQSSHEYELKANFLAHSPDFIEWPAAAFKSATAPLLVCDFGNFPFGTMLAQITRSSEVRGHRMEVKWVRKEQDLAGCQVLFVSHSAAKQYEKVMEALKGSVTFTVGEDQEFLRAGGMVSLEAVPTGLIFDVNLDAVRNGQLKLSAQLLTLARRVIQRSELAKG